MPELSQKIRVRFAPSPTGYVHIGSFRTALFNFLFARHTGGTLVLRVEDTDQNRLVKGAVENLLSVMHGIGIDFDEGPGMSGDSLTEKGERGPYVQSSRKEQGIYEKYALELIDKGSAYYCFCDENRLNEVHKEQMALKKPPMYDRSCRNLSKQDVDAKFVEFKASGRRPVVRQAIPLEGQTILQDLIYKDIAFEHRVLDDQILLKSDGFPTYHLAVVVDDHLMEISHVLRGEEWISSTSKHILLYQAFGWQPTRFAHLPLILNTDKSKLSKRQGDVAVEDFLAKGYLKEALLNFVAFLGWNPKTEQEVFSLENLIEQFDLAKVNKAASIFDVDKLDWMNGLYIRNKSVRELAGLLVPYWVEAGYIEEQGNKITIKQFNKEVSHEYLEAITRLEKDRLKKLSEIGDRTYYFFQEPHDYAGILVSQKSTPSETLIGLKTLLACLQALADNDCEQSTLEDKIKKCVVDNNLNNNAVLWPMRVALSGLPASPSPFEIASVLGKYLGKEVVLNRIQKAIQIAENL